MQPRPAPLRQAADEAAPDLPSFLVTPPARSLPVAELRSATLWLSDTERRPGPRLPFRESAAHA